MKKLLIAGGSHSDIPLIRAAQELGFHVTTTGNRQDDLGHAFSDAYVPCDYSDAYQLTAIAKRIGADAICPCCNDFSAVSCSYVAQNLGLAGYDNPATTELIHHKDKWRSFAQAHSIPSPRAIGCSNKDDVTAALSKLQLPILVKPVDLTGGKGICRVDHYEAALKAADAAFSVSKAKRIVLEEFVNGSRHGLSCFLKQGTVKFYFADDEIYHLSPYLVAAACTPSSCPTEAISQLIDEIERIANVLALADGIFHVQFILRDDGIPIIIEACRRAPGDLYVDLVKHATGVPYAEWIVRAAADMELPEFSTNRPTRAITRHCLMSFASGRFRAFDFQESVRARIIEQLVWAKPGFLISDPEKTKLGIVFVEYPNIECMRSEAPNLQALLRIDVDPVNKSLR
jgi:biotin carboxylase